VEAQARRGAHPTAGRLVGDGGIGTRRKSTSPAGRGRHERSHPAKFHCLQAGHRACLPNPHTEGVDVMRHIVLAMFAAFAVAPAEAAVVLTETVDHYPVRGLSVAALLGSIKANNPINARGPRGAGETRWSIGWSYTWKWIGDRACRIETVTTKLSVTTSLPAWSEEQRAPKGVQKWWQTQLAALAAHENGHRGHALDAANEFDRDVTALPATPNCGEAIAALATQVVEKYHAIDAEFDTETDYGRKGPGGAFAGAEASKAPPRRQTGRAPDK
jgi:predicted secreted Zn-dependent protease